jgi:hypothetical protein
VHETDAHVMTTDYVDDAAPAKGSNRLPLPAAVNLRRIVWPYAFAVGSYHLIALLAFVPWFSAGPASFSGSSASMCSAFWGSISATTGS